jgi:adenylate/nucleoside-diphosphate kinase
MFYYFKGQAEKDMFLSNPKRFTNNIIFSSAKGIPFRIALHKAAEIVSQQKAIEGHCPVTLVEEGRVAKGDGLLTIQYKDHKFCFESEQKLQKFLITPAKYHNAQLPVRMPPHDDPVSLYALQGGIESTAFMEQALGSVVTRGLREVSENRLKHPHMSVKETMLKCFAIFLKAENPANSAYLKEKYLGKMKLFIERCEIAEELSDLSEDREKKMKKGKWPEFKDKYYHELGAKYDEVIKQTAKAKQHGFQSYMK